MQKMKAWLRPNLLTKEDKTDFIAVPVRNGSVNVEDIIRAIKDDGTEITSATSRNVLQRFFKKLIEFLAEGYNVNIGILNMHPSIKGVFTDKTWNPEKHKLYVSVTQGQELKKAMAQVSVDILGIQADNFEIFSITDKSTGKSDGSLTKGKIAELKGSHIKILGEDGSIGLKFTNIETQEVVSIALSDIAINDPSTILFLVPPDIETGTYEVSVTTQFSGSSVALKQPKTSRLSYEVVIE